VTACQLCLVGQATAEPAGTEKERRLEGLGSAGLAGGTREIRWAICDFAADADGVDGVDMERGPRGTLA
jgi:hypothetical protein